MKRVAQILFALALVTTLAGAASANTHMPRADRRQATQRARIRQGVGSGELTPREAARLRMGERHIRRTERRAKSDGVVTPRERAHVNRELNRESRRIHRLKHNDRSI